MIFERCKWEPGTKMLGIRLFYSINGPPITVELDIPGHPVSINGPAPPAPPPGENANTTPLIPLSGGQVCFMRHRNYISDLTGAHQTGRGIVNRRVLEFLINDNLGNWHKLGQYKLRITCAGTQTIHTWCRQRRGYGFKVDTSSALPANIFVEDPSAAPPQAGEHLIGEYGGADNIITVAAYNAEEPTLDIARFAAPARCVALRVQMLRCKAQAACAHSLPRLADFMGEKTQF